MSVGAAHRDADVAVVGGGVVGLAVASALATRHSVVLLERHADFGRETTSRNSEVIHAGLYDPEGSLKARACVRGRELLYVRCEREGLPHRRLGKLVVAQADEDASALETLLRRGVANGVPGLELLDGREVRRREPAVRAAAALFSPESGIVDARALCLSLAAEAEARGGLLLLATRVVGIEPAPEGYLVRAETGGEAGSVRVRAVVNAAGLSANDVMRSVGLDPAARGEELRFCKGDYFTLVPGAPIALSHLVYPLPPSAGLGIHATLDLAGRVRFGPDASFVEAPTYAVDPTKARAFAEAAGRFLPALREEWLLPDMAGVRPRLAGPGEAPRDFVLREESSAGLPGFVNLVGIESPGLTAALALGEEVAGILASF